MNLFLTQALPKGGNLSRRSADGSERRRQAAAAERIASINILNKRNTSQHQFACF